MVSSINKSPLYLKVDTYKYTEMIKVGIYSLTIKNELYTIPQEHALHKLPKLPMHLPSENKIYIYNVNGRRMVIPAVS